MPFFPVERFVIEVEAAPDVVRDRLSDAVSRGRQAPFTGTVGPSSFRLRPVLVGRYNSFAPTVRGSFTSGIAGTHVEARLRILPAVAVFMAVWLSGAAAFIVAALVYAFREPSRFWFPIVGVLFLACGYLLMTLAFSFEARRVRRNLALLVSGTPAGELTRRDLSWLMDFRLRAAAPPERRFNQVFLTLYGIAGALTVLTWDRTVTACSNLQYHHRSAYSCPSSGRIALTWALLAVLIAAAFASRLALHKRVRRAYVPLVLVVIAVGALAAWLVTHHPRWGIPS